VTIDLDAVRHNVRALKPADSELMAVVKANAYGHGDVEVARAALQGGATWLGVALVEEGIRLRDAGIEAPILTLSEFPAGSESDALEADLTPTVYSEAGLGGLASAAGKLGRSVSVHLKVDTGMHRVGVWPPEDAVALARRAQDAGLPVQGLWTHFASADDDDATTLEQLRAFLLLVKRCLSEGIRPTYTHTANSAALIKHPESHLDIVRPGMSVYGLTPGVDISQLGLRPVLTWRSAVTMSKRLPAGERLSYGHTYQLERDATVLTVPFGYADGYSRRLSSRGHVLIRGRRFPVAGSVTMDQVLVDCGDVPVGIGEEVVLLGRQGEAEITAEELADLNGTINYEVVCAIGERVPREYVGVADIGGEE
jgi:alanine racemase